MKMIKVIGIGFLLLIFSQPVFATTGCLIGTRLYTSPTGGTNGGTPTYNDDPDINATGFCIKHGTVSTPCQVRVRFLIILWTYTNGFQGDYGTGAPTYCPIDTYVGWMLIPASLIGLLFIRKKYSLLTLT